MKKGVVNNWKKELERFKSNPVVLKSHNSRENILFKLSKREIKKIINWLNK